MAASRNSQHPGDGPVGAGTPAPVAAKAAAINAAQARPLTWKTLVKRALVVAVAGAAIYLVLPSLIAVLGAWPRLSTLNPAWFALALVAELASFTCNFALQRLALRTRGWFAVVTAGLSGNAVTDSLPGGDAAGAAVQFSMLTAAGFDTDTAVGGLTAFSLLGVGGLLALPLFALPAILAGVPVSPGLVHTALLGIAGFVLYTVFGVIMLRTERPVAALGRAAQSLWNWITRGWNWITHGHRQPVTGLDQRLLTQRDTIRAVLDRRWWQAVLLTVGRLGFDYTCLLAALRATGADPTALPGAAGLRRRQHRRPPPAHPGWARYRGGQPQRPADPGRRPPRLRPPGHSRLPGRVLLAPPARRAAGLPALPAPLRTAGRPARHAARRGLQRIARVYVTRAWSAEGRGHHFQPRRLSMTTITKTQATLSPTPRIRNAGHPFSMLPVRTSKFCPQKPARKEMGRKMVATSASRRLTTAVCLLAE